MTVFDRSRAGPCTIFEHLKARRTKARAPQMAGADLPNRSVCQHKLKIPRRKNIRVACAKGGTLPPNRVTHSPRKAHNTQGIAS